MAPSVRLNHKIRASQVRLIDQQNNHLGVFTIQQAIAKANEEGVDLIEISPNANPPVCKICSYSKFKYDQEKQEHALRLQQRQDKTKEIYIHPKIDDHDYQTKLRHIREFLEDNMKVRIGIKLHGRENIHSEFAFQLLARIVKDVDGVGKTDRPPKKEGNNFSMMLFPIPAKDRPKKEEVSKGQKDKQTA